MATVYINPTPGVAAAQCSLTLVSSAAAGNLVVPSLQDITLNNSNDVFTWTQLDSGSKKQVATTATNSISMNLVLDTETFFGNSAATANSAPYYGVFGLSKQKQVCTFSLYMGDDSTGANTKTVTGTAYVTGLAPTVSADSPVWVSPITLTVSGDYTVT
jgi:hypothetical protein